MGSISTGTANNMSFGDFLKHDEVWIQQILPFLGLGHYAFIGPVNKKMNRLYKEYWSHKGRPAGSTGTLYSAAFATVSCAEYWLRDSSSNKEPRPPHVLKAIAKAGNLVVIQWAWQHGFPCDEDTFEAAAGNGHLEVLQWLCDNGCPCYQWTCRAAALNGHLEL
ncbi:ankyrin repeat protein [Seminavis robusta]|uniref:Ankyrin repeat protein n=1 Tax=Seminavis robusta TaxID=568900 RepID=A0A9N8EH45_9STRA|nr:ankyrin repeat protein [Seminavis robusta]|eukprot:Sro1071_g237950.1 ankyrin repeat protein (164) ;mRNA; f:22223-22714